MISLRFDFRQKYSFTNALINLTDKIRHQINKGNYAWGTFTDFQKTFDTGILWNPMKQFVPINAYKSNLADVILNLDSCVKSIHRQVNYDLQT